ncbi:MAG: hypothetical protein KAR06_10925, partial [Deltaproteobacteria bacterium]|nr:hypothetical protein [Deltaproteobacteria bacterium]
MSKRFLKTNKEKTGWSGNILMTALLILAAVFIAFSLKPNQAQATNSLNSTVMTEIPGSPATCGKCHNDHSGKARRNNFGVLRYIFDGGSATMASTGEGAMDTDLDGVTTAVELAAGNFPGYPDRDGDGYVQFSARVDSGGVIYPAVTITGKYTPAGPVLGWDVDDGDSGQGNIATWSAAASANGSESTDVTPPDAVNNLRSSGVGTTAMNLAWTAPGDDGSTGTAHSFDIRYIDDGNGGPSSGYDLRDPADWVIMWDIPDCDVDDTTGSVAGITTAGTLATEAKCSNGGVLWNTGKIGPVMRVLNEPVTQVAGTSQSKTVSSIGSAAIRYTNVIANGTLYWYAMRTSDGVAVVDLLEDATIVIREGISPVSNIVAITAGPAGTGVGIQSFNTSVYNVTVGQAAGQSFTVEGYGFTLVDTAKLNNVAGAESVTCAISGKTDTAMTLTCDTSALTDATSFDVDLLASTTLKAAWTDAILIQAGPPDSTAPEDTTNLSSSAQTETSVTLAWTGAGDDGATGTPTLYDIRYSTGTVSEGTWAGDTQTGEPA